MRSAGASLGADSSLIPSALPGSRIDKESCYSTSTFRKPTGNGVRRSTADHRHIHRWWAWRCSPWAAATVTDDHWMHETHRLGTGAKA
jgi:hypothetical protein